MKPIIEKISFYPYCSTFCDETGAYTIERYESVKRQWIVVESATGEKPAIEKHVHELNMEAGKVEEAYIVGYSEKEEEETKEEK